MSIFLKTAPKITKGNHSGAIPTPFLETVPIAWIPFVFFACLDCLEEYANVLAYGFYCLEKPAHFRLLRGSDIFGSFGVCWTVSKSVLISWLMGFGIFVFFGREICSFQISEKLSLVLLFFFGAVCLEKSADFLAYGLFRDTCSFPISERFRDLR